MGMTNAQATFKIRSILVQIRNVMTNIDPVNNNYFRVGPGGRLDPKHLSNVFIKRDGLNEILTSGNDALAIRIRTFVAGMLRVMEAVCAMKLEYEAEHRSEEAQRIQTVKLLKDEITAALSCSPNQAQGHVRQFAFAKYQALGVVDKATPGFESAAKAVATVATAGQLARRRSTSVADNFAILGKDADRLMTSFGAADVNRRAAHIAAAPTQKEKRSRLNNAMNERVKRIKQFNFFAADPSMVGVEGATLDPRAQANLFFNQDEERQTLVQAFLE